MKPFPHPLDIEPLADGCYGVTRTAALAVTEYHGPVGPRRLVNGATVNLRSASNVVAPETGHEGSAGQTADPTCSSATNAARHADTIDKFGAALTRLRTEARLSLNDLAARFKEANLPGLTKATLSRSCAGLTLFQTQDQVIAFVTECGAEPDVAVWIAAWRRARADRRIRKHQPVTGWPGSGLADVSARS